MKKIAVCYATDSRGYYSTQASAWSVRKMLDEEASIYIITDSYWDPHVYNCKVISPSASLMSTGIFPECWNRGIPFSALFKLAIPLMDDFNNLDELVYFDPDTLVVSHDLKDYLYNLEVTDHEIMGVSTTIQSRTNDDVVRNDIDYETREYLGDYLNDNHLNGRSYIDSGVLIFNLRKIRANGLDNYKRKLELFWRGVISLKYPNLDQDFINIMLDVDTELPKRMNHIGSDFSEISSNILVCHSNAGADPIVNKAISIGYSKYAAAFKIIPDYPVDLSKKKQLFIYLCHEVHQEALIRYNKIVKDLSGLNVDVLWVLNSSRYTAKDLPSYVPCECYNPSEMNDSVMFTCLNNKFLSRSWGMVGSMCQWAIMTTIAKHPDYDYYWSMEYDVFYSGSWGDLIKFANRYEHDLICERLNQYSDDLNWPFWWNCLMPMYPHHDLYTALGCLTRMSRRMYELIREAYLKYNTAGTMFFENIWSTVAMNNGSCLDIISVGKGGIFEGTTVIDRKVLKKDKLYHPIKFNVKWDEFLLGCK